MARLAILLVVGCGSGEPFEEVRCGTAGTIGQDIEELVGCTTLAGSLRFGDTQLVAIEGLERLRVIEGTLNFFRNPNLVDLGGLRNLEVVGGELLVHHNDLLESAADLARVREVGALLVSSNSNMTRLGLDALATVNGDLRIIGNESLPQADAEAFAAAVDASGEITVADNQP